jgi:hypothetical protein
MFGKVVHLFQTIRMAIDVELELKKEGRVLPMA